MAMGRGNRGCRSWHVALGCCMGLMVSMMVSRKSFGPSVGLW